MQPVATSWFFYGLSAVAIVSALMVITRKNPVHSAISLVFTLLSLAGLYLMLYAPFVAGVQIILYVGGIMVLFLFVIMLVNIEHNLREEQFNKQWLVATIATVVLGALFGYVYYHGKGFFPAAVPPTPEQVNTQQIGMSLYTAYMFPFEIASVLLLVAIIGAVVMAKKRI
ncbi:MAG: NADH-quinone oxidoreductase subunit J [Candidatus Koribacter versatilis]|uniref:NADH-quinone oxidoreductase subunit J n=1 Tax=Candidatus Korobacter versatilis TaxID=658062 RepID=A0A932EQE1_9BACT|nr:NADH-quinone oxidoreductase subunit J [Candidatus Koribacter versatilis]